MHGAAASYETRGVPPLPELAGPGRIKSCPPEGERLGAARPAPARPGHPGVDPIRNATKTSAAHQSDGLTLALAAARVAEENRGRDVVVLDLRGQTSVFDFFVIATGTSLRQLHAIADEISRTFKGDYGQKRIGKEGYRAGGWVLMDYGDVVIHLFDAAHREYYDLEHLWGGAKRVPLESPRTEAASAG